MRIEQRSINGRIIKRSVVSHAFQCVFDFYGLIKMYPIGMVKFIIRLYGQFWEYNLCQPQKML